MRYCRPRKILPIKKPLKPKTYLTRVLPPTVMDRLRQETDLGWNPEDRVATPREIIDGLTGRQALICTAADKIGPEIMAATPELKVIANFGVGFNHIDVPAATARRIPVTNTPGVLTDTTADLAFALLLNAARRVGEGERMVRARRWPGWGPMQLLGADVTGATLGIIGFGRIGQALARRGRGFEMRLLYWNRSPINPAAAAASGATAASFEQVLCESDFVSLHVAYAAETHHLVGEPQLALMKPSAILINTTRGAVIDEAALGCALREKKIAAAALDVFEREPELEPALYPLENAVLAPHLGSATIGTRTRMGMMAVDNLLAACAGRRPPDCVNTVIFGG
jgi:glyoxylate reductase